MLPLAAWLIRNVLFTGQALGPRFASDYALSAAAAGLGRNAMSWLMPSRVALVHPYAGLALLVLLCLGIVAITVRDRQAAGAVIVCVTFAAAFAMMMLAAVTRTAIDPLADRILSPMYAPLIVAAVIAATTFLREARPATRRSAATAVVVVTSAALLGRTLPDAVESWKTGARRRRSLEFQHRRVEVLSYIAVGSRQRPRPGVCEQPCGAFPGGPCRYPSDAAETCAAGANHPHGPAQRPASGRVECRSGLSGGNREHVPSHTFSLREVGRVFVLEVAAVFADGAVYRMLAKDVDPRPHELQRKRPVRCASPAEHLRSNCVPLIGRVDAIQNSSRAEAILQGLGREGQCVENPRLQ